MKAYPASNGMRITFYGASKVVTGANYLVEKDGLKFLVDCGLFQGSQYNEDMNYELFPYDVKEITAVFVTHSHMDHVGRLPKLYKEGFRGMVYASEPSRGIMEVAFDDALSKLVDEASALGRPPLYGKSDIDGIMSHTKGIRYGDEIDLGKGIKVKFHDAGHILGSCLIEVDDTEGGIKSGPVTRVVFSGDLGNPPVPLLNPIDYIPQADYLIMESAYGSRIHKSKEESINQLREVIKETMARKSVLMIPSFAVERTQELLFILDDMLQKNEIPHAPIFLDSPLAIKVTKVYEQFFHYFNQGAIEMINSRGGLFNFDWLTITPTSQDSRKINDISAPKIIIAGSGMSMGGRILHHERRYLPGGNNTILFIGYQVANSLGRRILDGEQEVKVLGEKVRVHCHIENIGGFSAHADQNGLLKFVGEANKGGELKKIFLVQGEDESAQVLAEKIRSQLSIETIVPDAGYSAELE